MDGGTMNQNMNGRRRALQGAVGAAVAMMGVNARAQDNNKDAREIRIGQSAVLSGPIAPSVTSVIKGQNMAIDEVNRKGGIAGRKLRMITLDGRKHRHPD
jgi:branched-chain amino acid transport system substrate-binding protein